MDDPIALLSQHLAEATKTENFDATRAALATVDAEGHPSVRFVLVRQVDASGLRFYTNYESDKAIELDARPHAALAWHWSSIGVQVRAKGPVERASAAESDAYFESRERESQIGAWASDQSRPLASRDVLEKRVAEIAARYADAPVPRPPHWGGYVIRPSEVEIWHNGAHRLHDRLRYSRAGDGWDVVRLAP